MAQNPFHDEVIRAELVADPYRSPRYAVAPTVPRRKRSPLLAVVFLILDLPFLAGSIFFWVSMASLREKAMQEINPSMLFVGGVQLLAISAFFWLAAFLCAKELIQSARGR